MKQGARPLQGSVVERARGAEAPGITLDERRRDFGEGAFAPASREALNPEIWVLDVDEDSARVVGAVPDDGGRLCALTWHPRGFADPDSCWHACLARLFKTHLGPPFTRF